MWGLFAPLGVKVLTWILANKEKNEAAAEAYNLVKYAFQEKGLVIVNLHDDMEDQRSEIERQQAEYAENKPHA